MDFTVFDTESEYTQGRDDSARVLIRRVDGENGNYVQLVRQKHLDFRIECFDGGQLVVMPYSRLPDAEDGFGYCVQLMNKKPAAITEEDSDG